MAISNCVLTCLQLSSSMLIKNRNRNAQNHKKLLSEKRKKNTSCCSPPLQCWPSPSLLLLNNTLNNSIIMWLMLFYSNLERIQYEAYVMNARYYQDVVKFLSHSDYCYCSLKLVFKCLSFCLTHIYLKQCISSRSSSFSMCAWCCGKGRHCH